MCMYGFRSQYTDIDVDRYNYKNISLVYRKADSFKNIYCTWKEGNIKSTIFPIPIIMFLFYPE